jgi:pimeloyl-ACP methyl ester carboxylesterase
MTSHRAIGRPGRGGRYFLLMLVVVVLSAETPRARIEWSDLPAAVVDKAPDLRTGYLVVPERRFPSLSQRTVRLPFIIMKSRSASPQADPILFSAGGPGGSSLSAARNRHRNPLLDERDVILFEQRGTHWAEPSLMSPEIDAALRSGWGKRLNGDPDPAAVRQAMASTLRQFRHQGIDLAGYTTRESAADIAQLRRLLAIPAWNLYGVSYSTKLMLTVLRDHPEGVRSAILDSVLPPEADWDESAPANILAVLERVLQVCAEDAYLREHCPDLRNRFRDLLTAANRHPVQIAIKNPMDGTPLTVRLDGAGIMNCVYAALESASGIRRLPLVLDAACRGETQALGPFLEEYLGSTQGSAIGMRLAIWCNEEFPFERPNRMLHPSGLPPELKTFVQTAVHPAALTSWPQGRPDPGENRSVSSSLPVLIATGEFDPDTPIAWARSTTTRMPHAHLVEFAGMSHVPLFSHPEAARIMKAFLADPARRPEPGTIGTRPSFLHTLQPGK